MDDFNYLEEPPPIVRVNPAEARRKSGLHAAGSNRSSAPPGSRDAGAVAQPRSGNGVLLKLTALVVLSVQGWLYLGVRGDLADLRTRLEQAHKSLGQVWESAQGLDQDRMGRLGLLADSIRSVFDYTQGQVQQWDTTYANLGQRLDENDNARGVVNTRLDGFARADQVQRSRLDALERNDRTHSFAFEALSRRAQIQEANTHDVNATVASLRETLGKLDASLAVLEQQHASFGQLGRRVESLSGWADGFRRAGLSGDAVQGQLSALADDLRRIRIRVDSLRPPPRAVTSSEPR